MTILQMMDAPLAEELLKKRRSYMEAENTALELVVKEIVESVKAKGDIALLEFTKKFDDVDLTLKGIKVSEKELADAYSKVKKDEIEALRNLKKRIEKLERRKLNCMNYTVKEKGLEIVHSQRPIESLGCYVPGGLASYPSSLLMTVVPAKIAGVPRIAICSPPKVESDINPLILVAASICGVNEIYRVGGAQAVAALAYGTESISPVLKIVGAGNKFVNYAKILVSRNVAIDIPAGPSEILVLADETADPKLIALDLISQTEHSPDNVAGLVTTSREVAEAVITEVESLIPTLSRKDIVVESLSKNGFIFFFNRIDEAMNFVNGFAPEHLEIVTRRSSQVADKISSAGIIFLGKYTPVSAGDYCLGTNHVLPTAGYGRIYSELSVFDYVRRINIVRCSKDKLGKLRKISATLAASEGLPNHDLAIEGRFRDG